MVLWLYLNIAWFLVPHMVMVGVIRHNFVCKLVANILLAAIKCTSAKNFYLKISYIGIDYVCISIYFV